LDKGVPDQSRAEVTAGISGLFSHGPTPLVIGPRRHVGTHQGI
jgi:hypothetical protein